MDLFRNMEAVVLLGFGMLCAVAFTSGPIRPAEAAAAKAPAGPSQVIVITGKRSAPADKRALA